jgi:hypothetical protein
MKRVVVAVIALLGFACVAFSSQPQMKNRKARVVGIQLEKELTLGERPGGKEALFQVVRSFAVDKDGNIYVLDSRAPKLLKFSGAGKLLFSVGRKGQGPGELMVPQGIELGKNGSLLVYDIGNRRLTYFSAATGEAIEEISTAKLPRMFRIGDDSQGSFYGYQLLYDTGKQIRVISKFSPAMELIKEVFRAEYRTQENEIPVIPPSLFFRVMNDDGLLVARSDAYEFRWYDPAGALVKTAMNDYSPLPVTAADKEREIKEMFEGRPAPEGQVFAFPDHYPPIEHLITDDQDRIFVRTSEADKKGGHFYEAFGKDGASLGKFALAFTITCVAGDRMYSLETDENGFQQICRYRFRIASR